MATASVAAKGRIKEIVFEWEGKDKNGKNVRGEMRAGGEAMVSASLRRQGVMVSKVKKRRMSGGKAIKQKDIAVFTRQLSTMMRAGVPLIQSSTSSPAAAPTEMTRLLTDIRSDVETGTSLSAAFRKHPLYSTPCTATWSRPAKRAVSWKPCSIVLPSIRKRRWRSRTRSSRR